MALIALAWQWIALPAMKTDARVHGSGNVFKLLKSRAVAFGMAGCRAFFVGLYGPLIAIPILMSVIAVALIPLGAWVVPVAVLLGLWGLMATATPVGWWSWIAQAMPHDAEAGGGLMVAVIQFAIALGSTVGGVLFDASGYRSTFTASAALLLIGAFLTFQTSRVVFFRN